MCVGVWYHPAFHSESQSPQAIHFSSVNQGKLADSHFQAQHHPSTFTSNLSSTCGAQVVLTDMPWWCVLATATSAGTAQLGVLLSCPCWSNFKLLGKLGQTLKCDFSAAQPSRPEVIDTWRIKYFLKRV
jgi:hypothetical protein